MRHLVEGFQESKEAAVAALRRGDLEEARRQMLKAAEFLLKLADRSTGRIRQMRIENANRLIEQAKGLKERARSIQSAQPREAAEQEGTRAERFIVREKPDVSFNDIAGLEEAKTTIMVKVIHPLKRPDMAKKYGMRLGGGLLLYGPPGTGKTMLAKAVANEVDAPFYMVKPSDILSKWVGEAEKNVAALFEDARKNPLSVVFIDEVEALVPRRRSTQSSVMARVVPQFLAELEGFKTGNPILFIAATNEPWMIDPAMLRPGRFDEKIYVGLPNAEARAEIFRLQLKNRLVDPAIEYEELARRTEGYSGADIRAICERAAQAVFLEAIKTGNERPINMNDLLSAIERVHPSVTPDALKRYEAWRKTH